MWRTLQATVWVRRLDHQLRKWSSGGLFWTWQWTSWFLNGAANFFTELLLASEEDNFWRLSLLYVVFYNLAGNSKWKDCVTVRWSVVLRKLNTTVVATYFSYNYPFKWMHRKKIMKKLSQDSKMYLPNKKAVPLHATKALEGRESIAPTHSGHRHYMGWVVNVTPLPRFSPG
jgi:hypothetical protein